MGDPSLTNLRAVRPSGPKWFIAFCVVLVLTLAGWFFFLREPGPVGAAEDPGKVVLVSEDPAVADRLRELGFEIEAAPLADFEARVAQEGHQTTGPEAALLWADIHGFGYVAFATPEAHSFTGVPVGGDLSTAFDGRRFGVFSVGDLGTPAVVTTDSADQLYRVEPAVELLRALLKQPALAATLVGPRKLSTAARPLYERIEAAVRLRGAYGLADSKAKKIQRERASAVVDAEEASPKPSVLAGPLENSTAIALSNGGTLVLLERPYIQSAFDDVFLSVGGGSTAMVLPPGSADLGDAVACDGLGTPGSLRAQSFSASRDGSVVTRHTGQIRTAWKVDSSKAPCPLSRLGDLPGGRDAIDIGPDGRLVVAAETGDEVVLKVWEPGSQRATVAPLPGCSRVGDPVWLVGDVVAVSCHFEAELPPPQLLEGDPPTELDASAAAAALPKNQTWLYLVDTGTSRTLAVPLADVSSDDTIYSVLPIPGPTVRLLLRGYSSEATVLTLAGEASQLVAAPPLDEAAPTPPFVKDTTAVAAASREAFTLRALEVPAVRDDVVASPDGTHLAFTVDGGRVFGENLAVLALDDGKVRRVAISASATHHQPQFSSDGKYVFFQSEYDSADETGRVARRVPTP